MQGVEEGLSCSLNESGMPFNSEVLDKWRSVKQKGFCNEISLHLTDCNIVLERSVSTVVTVEFKLFIISRMYSVLWVTVIIPLRFAKPVETFLSVGNSELIL